MRMGRKPKYVRDAEGVEVHGLSRTPNDGPGPYRYFTTVDGKKKWFGSDEKLAIARFRQRHMKTPVWVEPAGPDRDYDHIDYQQVDTSDPAQLEAVEAFQADRDKKRLADQLKEWLVSDPAETARYTRLPELAHWATLKPPEPSLSLSQIGELYHSVGRPTDEKWARESEKYWEEFCGVVGGRVEILNDKKSIVADINAGKRKTAREIVADHITNYRDSIRDLFTSGKVSSTYVKHRFGQIKTIFSFAVSEGKDQAEITRVLNLCAVLKPPKKRDRKKYGQTPKLPAPIEPKHFEKLLEVCDEKWRAVFLLSLNCLLYPSEVAAVLKSEINLDAKTFIGERGKTGQIRVGVLWNRTVQAIREYQKTQPHQSKHLFISETSAAYTANHMGRNFRRRRKLAAIPESVMFENLRDGGYTAAIEMGASSDLAKLIAGHAVGGMSDDYVRRNPKMVAPASEAIERYYFQAEC